MESYYSVLGLGRTCSIHEIRRAYRNLAKKWHPDKCANNPAMLGEAKRRFQKIQEAYSVLSDPRKRSLYDAGMYDPLEEEVDEGLCDFMQEMWSLMSQVRDEEKPRSMDELRKMFEELAQGFESSHWSSSPQGCSGVLHQEAKSISSRNTSSFGIFGMSSYCR